MRLKSPPLTAGHDLLPGFLLQYRLLAPKLWGHTAHNYGTMHGTSGQYNTPYISTIQYGKHRKGTSRPTTTPHWGWAPSCVPPAAPAPWPPRQSCWDLPHLPPLQLLPPPAPALPPWPWPPAPALPQSEPEVRGHTAEGFKPWVTFGPNGSQRIQAGS